MTLQGRARPARAASLMSRRAFCHTRSPSRLESWGAWGGPGAEAWPVAQLLPKAAFLPGAHAAASGLGASWLPGPFLNPRDRQCYKDDGSSKSPDCPVCSRSLNKLAQPLPMAHCANSRLVCKISGDVMNENNPPMMLPNGYVYGYNVSGAAWGQGRGLGP